MSLITLAEVRQLFVDVGVDIKWLTEMKETVEDCDLGVNNKKLVGQLTQTIREFKENGLK
jgi:hypothetical protein